jgi:Bacterial PH domain
MVLDSNIRWYRNKSVISRLTRAGIGVNADGVTVRSALGRSRFVPWHDVVKFHVETVIDDGAGRYGAYDRGSVNHVTVICRDRPPLRTIGCRFAAGAAGSNSMSLPLAVPTGLDGVFDALEAVRRHAQHITEPGAS